MFTLLSVTTILKELANQWLSEIQPTIHRHLSIRKQTAQEKSNFKCGLDVRIRSDAIVIAKKKTSRSRRSITSDTCFHSCSCCSLLSVSKQRTSFLSIVEDTFSSTRKNLGSMLSTKNKKIYKHILTILRKVTCSLYSITTEY